jgi:hypothetical protein
MNISKEKKILIKKKIRLLGNCELIGNKFERMYMKIICRKYVLYTLFYVVHSIYTYYYLVRNGVVILSGKKG